MSVNCPICAGNTSELFAQLDIRVCNDCTHQFYSGSLSTDHVSAQYDDSYFRSNGDTSGYGDYLASAQPLRRHGERYADLIAPHIEDAGERRLLDIGCAAGFLMQGFAARGWNVSGIDPNASMVAFAQGHALPAYQGTLESVSMIDGLRVPDDGFDLVVMIQVIAHLADLKKAIAELARLVRPGGAILVETWDSHSRTAKLLGGQWHEYSPPNVLHYFSKRSLNTLMWQAGYRRVTGGRPGKKVSAGHARSLMRYKYGRSSLGKLMLSVSKIFPDEFTVPYPSEDLLWLLYQKEA